MRVVIIGAGVGGLFIAKKLLEQGHDVLLFEKNAHPGGLAISHQFKEIFYDIGPHIVFSKDNKILNEMLSMHSAWNKFERRNEIVLEGDFISYPFENYLGMLSSDLNDYCLEKFINNEFTNLIPENMLDFFLQKFGSGIVDVYLKPYNEKLWKTELKELDLQMVERIPSPPFEDVVNGAKGIYSVGYTHQAYFHYPDQGGIYSFIKSISKSYLGTNILHLNSEVEDIDLATKKVRVNTLGESRQYGFDKLISFMPLRELLFILHQQIQFSRDLIEKIEYLGLIYGVVELDTHAKSNFFALTIPDSDIVFHRLTYLNDLNNLNAIDSNKYFLFEITYKNEAQKLEILQNLDEKLIYGLIKTNITKSKELKSLEVKSVDKAYVVYNHFHKRVVNLANEVLTKNDIFLGGRIGGHKYYNMDQVIMNCYEILGKFEDF